MLRRGENRGSALIMVMLVVASITTIVFATQRIALVQFSQSVREEDNLTAYYAAQAGIEDGLLRYHFDRNVQTEDESMFRLDLTAGAAPDPVGSVPYEIPSNTPITDGVDGDFDPAHQYYDLAISYKTRTINIDGNTGAITYNGTLEKDDSLTLTGFPKGGTNPYFLRYVLKFDPTCVEDAITGSQPLPRVVLQQIVANQSLPESSFQVLAEYTPSLPDFTYDSQSIANLQIHENDQYLVSSIRIRAFYCDVQYAFATSTDQLGDGIGDDAGEMFDSLTTEILSTGYFGGAKRTLVAAVDRQTGDLIGVFDYLLYSGGNTGNIRR